MNPIVYEAVFAPIDPTLYMIMIGFILGAALIGAVLFLFVEVKNWLQWLCKRTR